MRTAVVTGASTGIGRAISLALAKEDVFVMLIARSQDRLDETQKLIEQSNGKSEIFIADLSSVESINTLISDIKEKHKQVDVLANVAGIWHGKDEVYANIDFDKFAQEVIVDTYMVGTVAPSLLAHAFIPLMPKGSKIINISGTFENGAKGWLPYYVSKRAIEDLTVGLSQELKERKIQVNCISPSDTAIEQYSRYFPDYIPEAVEPEIISQQVVNLCNDIDENNTGNVFVIKKDKEPYKDFHA